MRPGRVVEVTVGRPGLVKTGRGRHRQVKLQGRLTRKSKPK